MLNKITNIIKDNPFLDSFKKGSIMFIAFILNNIISIVTIPIFTKLLSVEDYGIVEVTNYYIRFFSILFPLNIVSSINYFWYRKDLDNSKTLGNIIFSSTISMFFFSVFYYSIENYLVDLFRLPLFAIRIIPVCVIGLIYLSLHSSIITLKAEAKRNAIFTVINTLVKSVASIALIIYLYHNYKGKLVAEIVGYVILFLGYFNYIFKASSFKFDFKYIKKILVYSLSTILITSSSFILTYFDALMINKSLGSEKAGLYSFAYKISSIYYSFILSFQVILIAKYNQYFHDKNYALIENEIKSLLKIIVICSAVFILFGSEIGMVLSSNKDYEQALFISPIITISYFSYFIFEMYNLVLYQSKKNTTITIIILGAGILNIVLNKIYIPIYGYWIAAFSTLISYFLMTVATYFASKYQSPYAPPIRIFLSSIIFVIGFSLIFYILYYYPINFYLSILIKMLIVIISAIYIYWNQISKFITKNE